MSLSRCLLLLLAPASAFGQAFQTQKLVGTSVVAGSKFGCSVSLCGSDLLCGTSLVTGGSHRAYAFTHAGGGWSEHAVLAAPSFGGALRVAIRGDIALLGAPAVDGYAWRFVRSGGAWGTPTAISPGYGEDEFGFSVAIGEDQRLHVGAPYLDACFPNHDGVVVGFCASGGSWTPNLWLVDPNACSNNYNESFGWSVAASGSSVAVGANGIHPLIGGSTGPGQAFVFEVSCASGPAAPAILANAAARFGEGVALDRDTLIVGSYGAAFAYARVGANWVAQGTLDPQDPSAGPEYGAVVAVLGDIALVGDRTSSATGALSGAVYVFRRSGSSWTRIQILTGNDTVAGDRFGSGVALDGYSVAVGAPLADTVGADSGAVYLFSLPLAPPQVYCTGKPNSLGCVPQIGFDGVPSTSAVAVFDVNAIQELNLKLGLLLYGTTGVAANPFQGSTLCIAPPLHRTAAQSSLGSAPPANDCSGSYHYDFNARIQSGFDPALVPGARVAAQYWSRDPADNWHTALSDALLFTIGP